jgi:ElaB/YqjD/DUF883 family membrane-anchored ribosome-binding protein
MDEQSTPANTASVREAMQNLVTDMKVLAADTRELLRQTTGLSGEQFGRLRARTRETLSAVEERLGPLQERITEGGRYAAQVSADHLRAHRWSTLAAIAAIGFAVAAIIAWQNEMPGDDNPEP